jgi:hypothetical protein
MLKTRFHRSLFVALLAIALAATSAFAYDQPTVNLGFTSFLDGGPPAGPGFYVTQYLQYYSSDQLNDADGNDLTLPDGTKITGADIDVWASLTQFIYQSDTELLFGGKWGLDVIVPYASFSADYDAGGPADNGGGFGDILVGPFLQWDPIMGKNGPRFMHRIELQMIFPTGKYDDDKELNPGSNFFSFNPYWAGTLFITPKWTVSTRLHYLWNAENDDPNRAYGAASDTQAGQAIHVNFASAYEVIPKMLRLGINGYYFKQITDTKVNGDSVSGSKEKVFGIGPGALFSFSPDSHLFFNAYFETDAENRPEGTRSSLRFVHHF